MKKLWMSIGELAGFSVKEEGAEYKAQLVELEKIKASLEESKGFKEKHEAAAADLVNANARIEELQAELTTAQDAVVAKEAELTTANDTLEAVTGERDLATNRVAELEKAAGINPSNGGAKKPEAVSDSIVDAEHSHNKFIKAARAKAQF